MSELQPGGHMPGLLVKLRNLHEIFKKQIVNETYMPLNPTSACIRAMQKAGKACIAATRQLHEAGLPLKLRTAVIRMQDGQQLHTRRASVGTCSSSV